MARFSMRAKHRERTFKMVRGEIRAMSEARGEDLFDNYFDAVYQFTKAVRAWRYKPQGVTYELHTEGK